MYVTNCIHPLPRPSLSNVFANLCEQTKQYTFSQKHVIKCMNNYTHNKRSCVRDGEDEKGNGVVCVFTGRILCATCTCTEYTCFFFFFGSFPVY